jgi:hypothetical protein
VESRTRCIGVSSAPLERATSMKCSLADLVARGDELSDDLTQRYPGEPLADQFHERLLVAKQAVTQQRPELLT